MKNSKTNKAKNITLVVAGLFAAGFFLLPAATPFAIDIQTATAQDAASKQPVQIAQPTTLQNLRQILLSPSQAYAENAAPVTQQEIQSTQKDQVNPGQMQQMQKAATDAMNQNPIQPQPSSLPQGQQTQQPRQQVPPATGKRDMPAVHLNPFQTTVTQPGQQAAPQPSPQQTRKEQPKQQKDQKEQTATKRGQKPDKGQKEGPPERKMVLDIAPPNFKTEEDTGDKGRKAEYQVEQIKKNQTPPQIIYDEGYQPVIISLRDITRVVCFSNIERTMYSKEKPFEIKTVGKDAFIKNIPFEVTDPLEGTVTHRYDDTAKELYIVCGNRTYSLILVPSDIPAQTIYLKTTMVDKETAKQGESALPYEETMLGLIKDAYMENIPDGYDVQENGAQVRNFEQIAISHTKTYTGAAYQILEFNITAKMDVLLDEVAFLSTIQPRNPLAISIMSLSLKQGEQTRAFIVRTYKDE